MSPVNNKDAGATVTDQLSMSIKDLRFPLNNFLAHKIAGGSGSAISNNT